MLVGLHFNFATTNSLGDSLRHQCRALHFSGHGETGTSNTIHTVHACSVHSVCTIGGLCFEDGQAGLQILPARALGRILAAGGEYVYNIYIRSLHLIFLLLYVGAAGNANLQFVFVSACHSREIGETFLKAGIRHVVCVRIESKV